LGLAIARQIIRQHGGDILVESAPGAGAKFIVTLPASQPADVGAVHASG
jgi:signal transduction histidine kinase